MEEDANFEYMKCCKCYNQLHLGNFTRITDVLSVLKFSSACRKSICAPCCASSYLDAKSTASWSFTTSHSPSQARMRKLSSSHISILVVNGVPTTKSLMEKSPSERVTASTPRCQRQTTSHTIHAVVQQNPAFLGNTLCLKLVRALMIICQTNSFSTAAATSAHHYIKHTTKQSEHRRHWPCTRPAWFAQAPLTRQVPGE